MFHFVLLLVFLFSSPCDPPHPVVLTILERFGLSHEGTWQSIQRETEKAWLHGRHKELWEIPLVEDNSIEETYALFTQLGMTGSIHASQCSYKYAVVLGSLEMVVRERFLFLKEEWDRGVRFEKLIVLTGDRPLEPYEKTGGKNETEMIRRVFEQLDLPPEWEEIVEFIDTPCPEGMRRPNTIDTFECWNPAPGSALIVSNQPFVYRQGVIARRYLPCAEATGGSFSIEQLRGRTQILLAELAQWIKLEYQAASS